MTTGGFFWAVGLVFFLVQADVCLGRLELTTIPPIAIFISFAVPLVIYGWLNRGSHVQVLMVNCRAQMLAFAVIATLALLGSLQANANNAEGGKFLIFPILGLFVFVVGIHAAAVCANEGIWRVAFRLGLFANTCSIIVDALSPGTFSILTSRAAGFGVNPNTGASLSVLLLILSLDWRQFRGFWRDSIVVATGCLGVFLTLSRSGVVLLVATLAYYYWEPLRKNIRNGVLFLAVAIGACGLLINDARDYFLNSVPMFQELGIRANLFLGTGLTEDTMQDERVSLVSEYLKLICEYPLLGWGTGFHLSDGRTGPHNMFLTRWVDNGIGGLVAYITFLLSMWLENRHQRNRLGLAMVLFVLFNSLFSHNMLEDKAIMLALGYAVGIGALRSSRILLA